MRDQDLTILHSMDEVVLVSSQDRAELLRRVTAFLAGNAPPFSRFVLSEFRDDQRRRMLVVEESC